MQTELRIVRVSFDEDDDRKWNAQQVFDKAQDVVQVLYERGLNLAQSVHHSWTECDKTGKVMDNGRKGHALELHFSGAVDPSWLRPVIASWKR